MLTGVIAAMSQLFTSPFMVDVEQIRKEHKGARNHRDLDRVASVKLLNDFIQLESVPDSLRIKAQNLVKSHSIHEAKSEKLYKELTSLKKSKKVKGFKNINLFLANFGNPLFIFVTGLLFIFLYRFRKNIDWKNLVKSFPYIGLMYLFVSLVYLIWVFNPRREIEFGYYITGILFASIFAVIGLKKLLMHLFKINNIDIEKEKLLKAIRILFKQLLKTNFDKGFVKEEKIGDYIETSNETISKVNREIKS